MNTVKFRLNAMTISLFAIIIFLSAIAFLGIRAMEASLKTVYQDRVVPLEQLKNTSDNYAIYIVDASHKLRNGNISWDEALSGIKAAQTDIQANWTGYIQTKLTPQEALLVDEAKALFVQADTSIAKLIGIIEKKDMNALTQYTIHELYPNIDPVTNKLGELVTLQLDVAKAEYEAGQARYQMITFVLMIGIILAIILALLALFTVRKVVNSIIMMQKKIFALAERGGDLTQSIDIHTKDEIGAMAESINEFLMELREIILAVKNVSTDMKTMSSTMMLTVQNLDLEITEISSTTEELAASMEETNASTEEINAVSNEIAALSNQIAEESKKSAENAKEIQKRAETVQRISQESSKNAREIYESSNAKLKSAMEEAKTVDSINVLAESILDITEQTNLLALNAAIEAARAGESGRGFAVVADEIRKLAENSKESVTQIQGVTQVIVQAVKHLTASVEGIMDYLENQVRSDSEQLVEIGNQYQEDAAYIAHTASSIYESSNEMNELLKTTVNAISEISHAAEESSSGSLNIAERATEILMESNTVKANAESSHQSSEALSLIVSRFTV